MLFYMMAAQIDSGVWSEVVHLLNISTGECQGFIWNVSILIIIVSTLDWLELISLYGFMQENQT